MLVIQKKTEEEEEVGAERDSVGVSGENRVQGHDSSPGQRDVV